MFSHQSSATTLYLVRHGETVDNANNIMQGQTQGQLNDTGMEQARQLCQRLVNVHIDAVVSSDLKRATEICRKMVTQFGMSENIGTMTTFATMP